MAWQTLFCLVARAVNLSSPTRLAGRMRNACKKSFREGEHLPTTLLRDCDATIEPAGAQSMSLDCQNSLVADVPAATRSESLADRRARRLQRFVELGGAMRAAGEAWHQCGKRGVLAALAREEQGAGRAMCHRNDIRADLVAAMQTQSAICRGA